MTETENTLKQEFRLTVKVKRFLKQCFTVYKLQQVDSADAEYLVGSRYQIWWHFKVVCIACKWKDLWWVLTTGHLAFVYQITSRPMCLLLGFLIINNGIVREQYLYRSWLIQLLWFLHPDSIIILRLIYFWDGGEVEGYYIKHIFFFSNSLNTIELEINPHNPRLYHTLFLSLFQQGIKPSSKKMLCPNASFYLVSTRAIKPIFILLQALIL